MIPISFHSNVVKSTQSLHIRRYIMFVRDDSSENQSNFHLDITIQYQRLHTEITRVDLCDLSADTTLRLLQVGGFRALSFSYTASCTHRSVK